MKNKDPYIGVYGNIQLHKGYCHVCKTYAFVIEGVLQCCDNTLDIAPTDYKQESEPVTARRKPRGELRKQILSSQDHKCLYCEQPFGKHVRVKAKASKLRVTWDHYVPFSYAHNQQDSNWVAACQYCNSWKSNLMFQSLDSLKTYLHQKWELYQ